MNISDKKINLFVKITLIMLVSNLVIANLGVYHYRSSPPILVGFIIMMCFSLVFYLKQKKLLGFSKIQGAILIVIGGSYLIYGVMYTVPTYLMYAAVFLIQTPIICSVLNEEIFEKLSDNFIEIFTFFGAIIILICLFVAPITNEQYVGILGNPNLFGEFISVLLICTICLYEKKQDEGRKKEKYFALILSGMIVGFILFTESRTTLITFVLIVMTYIIYIVANKKPLIKRLLSFLIVIAIMVPSTFMVLGKVTPILHGSIGEFPTFNETISGSTNRYLKGIAGEAEEGDVTSGRAAIWNKYYEEISFKGNPPEDLAVPGYSGGHGNKANAHNTFLQVAYQAGIPAAIAFILQVALIGIYLLRKIKRREVNITTLFFLGVYANSLPRLMLANPFSPYGTFSMTPYWLLLLPMAMIDLSKGRKERKQI